MITVAIETSCDETALCLLETRRGADTDSLEYRILANLIHSQVDLHKQYGGVFPIMAKREHAKNIMPLIEAALAGRVGSQIKKEKIDQKNIAETDPNYADKIAKIKEILKEKESDLLAHLLASPLISQKPAIDRIAVTQGPGLEPALWVGVNLAKALGILWDIPVVGVNHMEGHILGSLLPSSEIWNGIESSASDFKKLIIPAYPALALLISGGHTELVLVKKENPRYEVVGRTKDDALGEAFDKTARMLGLPYPGGPEISRLAEIARSEKNPAEKITLPRPMIHSHDLDFSFSGLKTAVLYGIREITKNGTEPVEPVQPIQLTDAWKKTIAREFEDAVTEVLVSKTAKAIELHGAASLIVGGGVIANKHITSALKELAKRESMPVYLPPAGVSGDNALMIAVASALSGKNSETSGSEIIKANGNLSL